MGEYPGRWMNGQEAEHRNRQDSTSTEERPVFARLNGVATLWTPLKVGLWADVEQTVYILNS